MGEDQKQHIELCRDVAQRFNQLYGDTFVIPKGVIPEVGARVMGLDDPSQKMSKSREGRGHAVLLTDQDEEIQRSIRRAVTDSGREIRFSEAAERTGVNNLLTIYQALTRRSLDEVEGDFRDARGYGDLKAAVADLVVEALGPIRSRYEELVREEAKLDALLAQGAEQARAVAEPKVELLKKRVGLMRPS